MKSPLRFWRDILAYVLAIFFIMSSVGNILSLGEIPNDYVRWGYPDWFHYVTGAFLMTAAVLLLLRSTRFWGATIGFSVMCAACATVLFHGEVGRMIPPIIVLVVCATLGWFCRPEDGMRLSPLRRL